MPKKTLQPNDEVLIQTSGKFLSIIDATTAFKIHSPSFGVLVGEVGRQYELTNVSEVTFVNDSGAILNLEYEVANIKVSSGGKGLVSVSNEIVVKRIVEAIQVNATSTVENGKMSKLVSNNFEPISFVNSTIVAGATVKVLAARAALNRLVTIQLITDDVNMGEVRIANSALNATATSGIFLQGNKDAPAGYEWETETDIYVHNPTASAVTIAGGEQWRT